MIFTMEYSKETLQALIDAGYEDHGGEAWLDKEATSICVGTNTRFYILSEVEPNMLKDRKTFPYIPLELFLAIELLTTEDGLKLLEANGYNITKNSIIHKHK